MSVFQAQKLLIVEDEPLIALSMEDYAKELGIGETKIAMTYSGARDCISRCWPTLAVVDIRLADGSGFDLGDRLISHGIPFIFTTGLTPADVPLRFGTKRILGKPVDYVELSEAIRHAAIHRQAAYAGRPKTHRTCRQRTPFVMHPLRLLHSAQILLLRISRRHAAEKRHAVWWL